MRRRSIPFIGVLLLGGCSFLNPDVKVFDAAQELTPFIKIDADWNISSEEPLNQANAEWIVHTCPSMKFEVVGNSIRHTTEGIIIEKIRCLPEDTKISPNHIIVFKTD